VSREPSHGRSREAKRLLAEIVIKGAAKSTRTSLSVVFCKYFEERTDKLASAKHARLAGRTLLACWGDTVRVEAINEAKQKEFAEWSIGQGHSLGYISRNLSVLAAALSHAKLGTKIIFKESVMAERWALAAKARAKRFTPSDGELARVLAAEMPKGLWRWFVISLLTGARPAAVVELTPAQRNRSNGTLDLNPAGRRQNKKYRATVREPAALTAWLDVWETEMREERATREKIADPDISADTYCGYANVESVQSMIDRVRKRAHVNVPALSSYSCRHKIATVMRKARLPREERELQMGHARPEGYGEWDPDYLQSVADALDAWWASVIALVGEEMARQAAHAATEKRQAEVLVGLPAATERLDAQIRSSLAAELPENSRVAFCPQTNLAERLVGERGFEPPAPTSRTWCSTRLSYSPAFTVGSFGRALSGGRRPYIETGLAPQLPLNTRLWPCRIGP
jgi:integrase